MEVAELIDALRRKAAGVGETGLTLGSGALASLAAAPYGVAKTLASGKYGTKEGIDAGNQAAADFIQRNTYAPRSEEGQENLRALATAFENSKLPPVVPEAAILGAIPKQAVQAQALRAGIAAEKAIEPFVINTMNKGGKGAELLDALTQGSRSQIFIGPESKLWNSNNAFRAANMASKGGDPKEIWIKTGTFKGPDGIWRQEIDDSGSIPGQRFYSWGEAQDLRNGDSTTVRRQKALLHPKLSAAYPETKETSVTLRKGPGSEGMYFNGDFGPYISTKADPQNLAANRSTMLHELQHQIQELEGFSRGGTPEMFKRNGNEIFSEPVLFNAKWLRDTAEKQGVSVDDLWKKQNRSVMNEATLEAAKHPYLDDMYQMAAGSQNPYASYLRLGGEAESRAVEKRMNYSPEKRQEVFPLDDYDVPVDELIMFGNHGQAHKQFIQALRKKQ